MPFGMSTGVGGSVKPSGTYTGDGQYSQDISLGESVNFVAIYATRPDPDLAGVTFVVTPKEGSVNSLKFQED